MAAKPPRSAIKLQPLKLCARQANANMQPRAMLELVLYPRLTKPGRSLSVLKCYLCMTAQHAVVL